MKYIYLKPYSINKYTISLELCLPFVLSSFVFYSFAEAMTDRLSNRTDFTVMSIIILITS